MSFTFTETTEDVLSCDSCTYISTEKHFADGACPLCHCEELSQIGSVTLK